MFFFLLRKKMLIKVPRYPMSHGDCYLAKTPTSHPAEYTNLLYRFHFGKDPQVFSRRSVLVRWEKML